MSTYDSKREVVRAFNDHLRVIENEVGLMMSMVVADSGFEFPPAFKLVEASCTVYNLSAAVKHTRKMLTGFGCFVEDSVFGNAVTLDERRAVVGSFDMCQVRRALVEPGVQKSLLPVLARRLEKLERQRGRGVA